MSEYKSPFLLKLQECLKQKGRKSQLKGNTLQFEVPVSFRGDCYKITVIEEIPSQATIYAHYMLPFWSKLDTEKREKIICLLKELSERNGQGVYYKTDRKTGNTLIEGFFFENDKNLCKTFRHFYTEIAKRRQNLPGDLGQIS